MRGMSKPAPYAAPPPALYPRFTRSRRNLMVAGIASGLARYFGVEERWVRPVSYTHLTLPTIYSV